MLIKFSNQQGNGLPKVVCTYKMETKGNILASPSFLVSPHILTFPSILYFGYYAWGGETTPDLSAKTYFITSYPQVRMCVCVSDYKIFQSTTSLCNMRTNCEISI